MRPKKLVLVALSFAALSAALALPAFSEDNNTVDVSVTPALLAVNVSVTDHDFGTMALSVSNENRTTKESPDIQVTNTGTVNADLQIQGANATGTAGNTAWTLNCAPANTGTVGVNQYVLRYALVPGGGLENFDAGVAICATSNTFATNTAPTEGPLIRLQIATPVETTGYGTRSSTVLITAVLP